MEIWWNSQPMKVAIQCCRIRLSSKICHGRILPFLLYRRVTFTFSKRARSNHPSRTSVTSLGQFHCSLLTPLKLMLILSIMHLRFWTMVLNPCLMVLNHFMINLKQISLYSSISKHLLIGILFFSWNMPAALQKRENQAILWYVSTATTNLYSKVLILLVNATNDTYSLYKLMLSLL